jgi:hypothetical protein
VAWHSFDLAWNLLGAAGVVGAAASYAVDPLREKPQVSRTST